MNYFYLFLLLLLQTQLFSQEILRYRSPVKLSLDGGVTWQTAGRSFTRNSTYIFVNQRIAPNFL